MISRRVFLSGTVAACTTLMAPALLAAVPKISGERSLRFYNLHTDEHLTSTFWVDGHYVADGLADISHLLRDFRTGEVAGIDIALLDRLHMLQQTVGDDKAFHVISGYRSPVTNAALSSKSSGVAKRSLHMDGRAIDIRVPGIPLKTLRKAALAQRAGGVGYYPKSDFVHIDTGRTRFW